jgi:hypothetical protein
VAEERLFENQGEFEAWLKDKPYAWAVILAARSALRLLPLINNDDVGAFQTTQAYREKIILPIFRALFISHSTIHTQNRQEVIAAAEAMNRVRKNSTNDEPIAAFTANIHVAEAALVDSNKGVVAKNAAKSAEECARFAARVGYYHRSARAAYKSMWEAIDKDALLCLSGKADLALLIEPLWPEVQQSWINKRFQHLKAHLLAKSKEDWGVWLDWYEARLTGGSINIELESARAQLDDRVPGVWDQPVSKVNSEIRKLIEEFEGGKPVSQLSGPVEAQVDSTGLISLARQTPDEELAGQALEQMFMSLKRFSKSFSHSISTSNVNRRALNKFQDYDENLPEGVEEFQSIYLDQIFRNALKTLEPEDYECLTHNNLIADLESIEALHHSVCMAFEEFRAAKKHSARIAPDKIITDEFWQDLRELQHDELTERVQTEEAQHVAKTLREDAEEDPTPEKKWNALAVEYNYWAAAKSYLSMLGLNMKIGAHLIAEEIQVQLDKIKGQQQASYDKDAIEYLFKWVKRAGAVIKAIREYLNIGGS